MRVHSQRCTHACGKEPPTGRGGNAPGRFPKASRRTTLLRSSLTNVELNPSHSPSLSSRDLPLPSPALLAWPPRPRAPAPGHNDVPSALRLTSPGGSPHLDARLSTAPLHSLCPGSPPRPRSCSSQAPPAFSTDPPPPSASQIPCLRSCPGFWIYSQVCPGSIDGVFDFTPGTCVWIDGLEERKLPVAPAPLSGHVGSSCFQWQNKDLGGLPSWGETDLEPCSGALVSPQEISSIGGTRSGRPCISHYMSSL